MHPSIRALAAGLALTALPLATLAAGGAEGVDAAWKKAILANDVEAVIRNYADDAVLWLPDAGEARGKAAIRATYEGLMGANTVKEAKLKDVRYRTMGKTSVAWGHYELVLEPKAGGKPVTLAGRFSEVAEKRGGRWVYIVDHASAEPPPPPNTVK